MTWQNQFFRTFTRGVQFLQRLVPDDSPRSWKAIRDMSRYVGYPAQLPPISIKRETRHGIPCEWLLPETPQREGIVLAIHGGANVFKWHAMHRHMYGWITHWAQHRTLAPDFRVGPEHPYPAGVDDCLAVYQSLLDEGIPSGDIVIMGDSSGGNIAAALLLRLRDEQYPLPAAVELIAPVLDVTFKGDNPLEIEDPFTNLAFIQAQFLHYCRDVPADDPMCSPVYADLDGLPPLRIDVGEDEILRNDAVWFADNARSAQVPIELVVWDAMWHGWYLYAPYLPEATQVHQAIASFVQEHI